jgi:hypothetical protein
MTMTLYYTHGLLYNDFVAASNGAFVYNPQDTKAEYVNEQINISNNEIINLLTKIRCN